jgi:type VI secretion system protein ImpJ
MGVRPYSKVVWNEGMHLAQHHFQAQSRYLEASTASALSRLCFKPYGFLKVVLDEEAIREGTIAILEARGVMPDGLAFEFPQGDALPSPLAAKEGGGGSGEPATVYLAVPAFRPGRSNCDPIDGPAGGSGSEHRYRAEAVMVQDENTGSDKRDVLLASKNFRLAFAPDINEDLVAVPMARVQRGPSGQFEYIQDFIPPCLHIGATPRLVGLLGGVVEMLRSKGEVMAQRRATVGDDLADLSSEEVLSYWMSHSIHSGLAGLRHLTSLPRCHPEDLFREMARLAGALSTFSTQFEPGDLPPYDHDDLTECFSLLHSRVRRLLEIMVPESFILVNLDRKGPNVLSAHLEDARVFRKAEWVLQVSSASGGPELLRSVPTLVKVCSAEDILRLVDDANPGLPLEHLAQLPSSIPRRLGSQYFRVIQTGPCWQLIQSRSSIGIYVPDILSDVRMELVVVQV